MDDVDVGVVDEVAEIVIFCHGFAEAFFSEIGCRIEVIAVDVAKGNQAASLVAVEVSCRTAYAAGTDDTSGKLIARSNVTVASEDMTRDDRKETGRAQSLKKCPSTGFHNRIVTGFKI